MRHRRVLRSLLVSSLVALAIAVAGPALTHAADQPISSPMVGVAAAGASEAFWTDERMRTARPMPLALARSAPRRPEPAVEEAAGPPMIVSPRGPGDQTATAGETAVLAGTAPFSFTRYRQFPDERDQYMTFPYSTVGKLFFNIPGQGAYVCSAATVAALNRSVVWTAGHCLYTPGVGWHTDVVYVPGYWFDPARGKPVKPFGKWNAKVAFVPSGWAFAGMSEYDLGAVVMNLGGKARRLPQRIELSTGGLGFVANAARRQHWHIFGYPADPRDLPSTPPGPQFDGTHQEVCAAGWATDDQPDGAPAVDPPTLGVGCDQTGGASGGPWVVNFNSGNPRLATNILNGVSSYRYVAPSPPANLRLFSPYFGGAAANVYIAAGGVTVP